MSSNSLQSDAWIQPVSVSERRTLYHSPLFAIPGKVVLPGKKPAIAYWSPGPERTTFRAPIRRTRRVAGVETMRGAASAAGAVTAGVTGAAAGVSGGAAGSGVSARTPSGVTSRTAIAARASRTTDEDG